MQLAVVRAGYTAFPISTRNSALAVVHLLTKTHIGHLIVGPEEPLQRLAHDALKKMEEQGQDVPSMSTMPVFEDLYREEENFTLLSEYKEDMLEVTLYLHSSGLLP